MVHDELCLLSNMVDRQVAAVHVQVRVLCELLHDL